MTTLQILDFLSTFAFAMVGARVAATKNMDYGGIAFVASVTALTGGTFRNLVLQIRPAWLEDSYLLIAKDEFGEVIEIELADDAKIKLYILQ